MKKILPFLFIAAAASFNAVTDTTWTHFGTSIFKNLDPNFWNAQVSWRTAYNFLGWVRFDAYHLSKMFTIGFVALAVISYQSFSKIWVEFLAYIITWSIFFELFYTHLL